MRVQTSRGAAALKNFFFQTKGGGERLAKLLRRIRRWYAEFAETVALMSNCFSFKMHSHFTAVQLRFIFVLFRKSASHYLYNRSVLEPEESSTREWAEFRTNSIINTI